VLIDFIVWLTAVVLLVALWLPRMQLHMIGLFGMMVMTWRAVSFSNDMPMAFLNGCTTIVHALMVIRLWRNPDLH